MEHGRGPRGLQASHDGVPVLAQDVVGAMAPRRRQGDGVGLGLALPVVHPDHQDAPFGGHGHGVRDLDGLDPPPLAEEPGPGREPLGQHGLDGGARGVVAARLAHVRDAEGRRLRSRRGPRRRDRGGLRPQGEPVEAVRPEREGIEALADGGERRVAEQLQGHLAAVGGQVQLDVLHEAGEVGDHEEALAVVAPQEREHLPVLGEEHLHRPPTEGLVPLAQVQDALGPPQQRLGVVLLHVHVDGLVVVFGVADHRQVEPLGVGAGEAGVAVRAPLHGRAHAVAVAQVVVVAHPQLVAVIDDGSAGQREEQRRHQLDLPPAVAEQRGQPPADAEVDAGLRVLGVDPVHVVPLLVGDHLQRQLVVVAQEQHPLAGLGDGRGLLQHVHDGEAVLGLDAHEHARHEREVEGGVALVSRAGAEIGHRVLRPLVRLRQQHPPGVPLVHVPAQLAQEGVGLGQVLAVGPLPLEEVGDGVQAQPVHAHASHPEVHGPQHRLPHLRVVEVEVRLVGVEAVPVVGFRHGVPGPVRALEVLEDDPGLAVALGGVAPDVEVPPGAAGRAAPRALEPGVLVRGVVQHHLRDHPEAPAVRLPQEQAEVAQVAVRGVDAHVAGDVVAVVLQRRGVEGQEPERGDPQVVEVVQLRGQAAEVAHAVALAVVERADVQLVDDRVLVPVPLVGGGSGRAGHSPPTYHAHGAPLPGRPPQLRA